MSDQPAQNSASGEGLSDKELAEKLMNDLKSQGVDINKLKEGAKPAPSQPAPSTPAPAQVEAKPTSDKKEETEKKVEEKKPEESPKEQKTNTENNSAPSEPIKTVEVDSDVAELAEVDIDLHRDMESSEYWIVRVNKVIAFILVVLVIIILGSIIYYKIR